MSSPVDIYGPKSVMDLPAPFRSTFSFRYFNSLQSECFSSCFCSDINMVISAPTGSGKTVLFELCILRLLSKFLSVEGNFNLIKGTLKTIYIAPSKALVQEKLRDWNQKFCSWGINCLELTGDNEFYNVRSIQDADIILTTPEKFDAVTRYRIKDGGLSFFSDIALVLIDEVHLLNDPRGAALEAIVSRIKMLSCNTEFKSSPLAHVRFLAVSATIPNVDDLAEWLMVPAQGIKRFGEEMRPVQLTTRVFGYAAAKNDFLFEKRLQNYIFDILMQYSRGKSALVFCSTRRGAQEAAQRLSQTAMAFGHSNPFIKSREQEERLREASLSCSDKQMQSYILYGVGYHNGGLSLKDRSHIEGLFLNGDLQVLCTTNTLAHGINLPAHTVVIKSTQHFNKEKGMYLEYDRSMILQMCGRAGRPPFDDTGIVIIMTRKETVHLYENLLNGCEMVESQLLPCITEHLTAEIVQLSVADITRAIEWMKCSYLYVRMKKNPENYVKKKGLPGTHVEKHLQAICVQKINELSRHQLIWTDEDGFLLKPLEPGRLMTKFYLKFYTMKHIMQAPAHCTLEEALHIICRAEEIAWIQLRRNEKKLLNDINMDKDGRLRFHILGDKGKRKKRIQTREEKIFILANDCLTGDPLVHDLSMSQDMNSICSNGCRIAKCMKEYFIFRKNYKGALSSTLLAKSLYQKLWDDSPYLLKQLQGIGMVTAKALHSMGVQSFDTLAEADPRKIEMVTGRKYPFGNHIKESLLSLPPKVKMTVEKSNSQKQGKSKVVITLTRLSQSAQPTKRHYADVMVGVEEDNLILFHEKIRVDEFSSPYSATILFPNSQQVEMTVKADLIFEEFIGMDIHQKVVITDSVDYNIIQKTRGKQPSSVQPKDVYVIDDDNHCAAEEPHYSNKSKEESDSMPSFKLLDEESEEGVPALSTEDDECKIISEKTVFEHIREKARSLPTLPMSNNACSPSLETLNLIRKRTHERQVDYFIDLEETGRRKVPCHDTIIQTLEEQCTFDKDLSPDDYSSSTKNYPVNTAGNAALYPEALTGKTIFEHIRRKANSFLAFENLKTSGSKSVTVAHESFPNSQSDNGSFAFNGINATGSLELIPKKARRVSVPEGAAELTDNMLSESTSETNGKISSRTGSSNDAELKSTRGFALTNFMLKHEVRHPGRFAESNSKKPSSPSLLNSQSCCSLATAGENNANSFMGLKSVFSFL